MGALIRRFPALLTVASSILALTITIAWSSSCRQVAGISDREPGRCGGFAWASGEKCADCTRRNCCAAASGCGSDATCNARLGCFAGCSDDGCRGRCLAGAGAGGSAVVTSTKSSDGESDARGCITRSCAEECGLSTCGGVTVGDACGKCASTKCCEHEAACAASEDCLRYRTCSLASCKPGNDAHTCQRCTNDHPLGASLAAEASYCKTLSCADECLGWLCVGNVKWPEAKARSAFAVTLRLSDYAIGASLPGLVVKACSIGEPSCEAPFGQTTTNDDGFATLDVTPTGPPLAFRGFIEVTGTSNGQEYRTLIFYTPPLVGQDGRDWAIASKATVRQISDILGASSNLSLDPARGLFVLFGFDCRGTPASGLRMRVDTIDPGVHVFYTRDRLPVVGPTSTIDTPGGNWAVAINVPPGFAEIASSIIDVDGEHDVSRLRLLSRPGFVTQTDVRPSPLD